MHLVNCPLLSNSLMNNRNTEYGTTGELISIYDLTKYSLIFLVVYLVFGNHNHRVPKQRSYFIVIFFLIRITEDINKMGYPRRVLDKRI